MRECLFIRMGARIFAGRLRLNEILFEIRRISIESMRRETTSVKKAQKIFPFSKKAPDDKEAFDFSRESDMEEKLLGRIREKRLNRLSDEELMEINAAGDLSGKAEADPADKLLGKKKYE